MTKSEKVDAICLAFAGRGVVPATPDHPEIPPEKTYDAELEASIRELFSSVDIGVCLLWIEPNGKALVAWLEEDGVAFVEAMHGCRGLRGQWRVKRRDSVDAINLSEFPAAIADGIRSALS